MRPVLEAAVAVAKVGRRADPPIPPPPILRPYLDFRRLTGPALDAARRALDDDAGFRDRVRQALDASTVLGRASVDASPDEPAEVAARLVLERPDGWEVELAELVASVAEAAEEADAVSRARRLDRELERARAERDEALTATRASTDDLDRTAGRLRASERTADDLRAQLVTARAEVDRMTDDRQRAIRDLKATETRLAARQESLRTLRAELDDVRAEVEDLRAEVSRRPDPSPGAAVAPPELEAAGGGPSGPVVDRATIAAALQRVTSAASKLTEALGEVAAVVAVPGAPTAPAETPVTRAQGDRPRSTGTPRRRPKLPVGMFDDSPQAAQHLVRLPGAMLLVDGYNVSLAGWPDLSLPDQRRRLVDAVGTLAARTGCTPLVVFDGAEAGSGLPGESRVRGVQVRFTEPGVEADDVLLSLVGDVPLERAVVVASSDRRVAEGARARGAATVSSQQLLAVLRG